MTLLASMVGSTWLGSPWLRIQVAHSSSSWVGLPFGRVVVVLPLPLPLLLDRLATCGEPEPPHAANPITAAAAASTASPPDRWYAFVMPRLPGSCIAAVVRREELSGHKKPGPLTEIYGPRETMPP